MSFDLTNKNIKDTFQNLLQRTGSEGHLYDLVGNQVGNLTIGGTLTAHSYITSQSVVNTSSGSTAFGNSSDDSHTFQGSITASGDISSSGTIESDRLYLASGYLQYGSADGPHIKVGGINVVTFNPSLAGTNTFRGNLSASGYISTQGNITASGNISSSGTINASEVLRNGASVTTNILTSATQGQFGQVKGAAQGTVLLTDLGAAGNPKFNHITASGNISASGLNHIFGGTIETNTINASTIGAATSDVTFRGDNITITSDAAGDIKFKEAITEVMRYDGGLDAFGIGTSTPSSKLTVEGSISASLDLLVRKGYFSSPVSVGTLTHATDMELTVQGDISASGDFYLDGEIKNDITASGNISASGTITGNELKGGATQNTGSYDFPGAIMGYNAQGINIARAIYNLTTSIAVVDAGLHVVFVAPKSGIVEIEVQVQYDCGTSGKNLSFDLSDAASYNQIQDYYQQIVWFPDESDDVTITHKWVVTGLTAGTTYQYWFAAKASATLGTPHLQWGGNNVGHHPIFIMKATALPSNTTIET